MINETSTFEDDHVLTLSSILKLLTLTARLKGKYFHWMNSWWTYRWVWIEYDIGDIKNATFIELASRRDFEESPMIITVEERTSNANIWYVFRECIMFMLYIIYIATWCWFLRHKTQPQRNYTCACTNFVLYGETSGKTSFLSPL